MTVIGTDMRVAKELLEKGEVVAIPTETVYGLAANALDEQAVIRIFEVKNRPFFDPLIVHSDSLQKITHLIGEIPEGLRQLAKHFMPGALTILVPKKEDIPNLITSGLDKVAIRIPNHPVTLQLLQNLDFPLAAPSANPFGYVSPTTASHVMDQLSNKIPYILDGGPCQIGLESTIVDQIGDQVIVLRKGGIPVEEIESVVGKVEVMVQSSSRPSAPGMLDQHYAPQIPVTLKPVKEILQSYSPQKIGCLNFQKKISLIPDKNQMVLSPTGDLVEAAQHFFSYLRQLDKDNYDIIIAELVPERDLGRAINDKLRRAVRDDI